MGGFIMKKILAALFVLTILGSSVIGDKASATIDEMPKLTNISVHEVSQLK